VNSIETQVWAGRRLPASAAERSGPTRHGRTGDQFVLHIDINSRSWARSRPGHLGGYLACDWSIAGLVEGEPPPYAPYPGVLRMRLFLAFATEQERLSMPSAEIQRVREYWDRQASAERPATIEEMRLYDDYWAALTGEPGEVDYAHAAVGGVRCLWSVPKDAAWDRVILCFHGGGYMVGSPYSHRKLYGHLAKAIGCRALLIDYRLTPEHPYPAQLDDALAVYRGLLEQGLDGSRIAFAGDSADGGLALGAALRARDEGLSLPAAAMVMSAWTDMSLSGASYDANRSKDLVFRREMVDGLVLMLLGAEPDRRNPYASPIAAELTGLPSIYLQVGGDEGLLDDSAVFAERARAAGVEVRIDVFPEMLHSFQMAAGRAPEADDALARFADWARPRLGLADRV
jgi:monoterpene epsilon-lactone hydrolase